MNTGTVIYWQDGSWEYMDTFNNVATLCGSVGRLHVPRSKTSKDIDKAVAESIAYRKKYGNHITEK